MTKKIIVLSIIIIALIGGVVAFDKMGKKNDETAFQNEENPSGGDESELLTEDQTGSPSETPDVSQTGNQEKSSLDSTQPDEEKETSAPEWKYSGLAIAGGFADADIVELSNGSLRMYYSEEPETSGFQGRVYSAISSDGLNWTKETGTRMTWATFPSVMKLSDARYRMYFQNAGLIKSAISSDGLSWSEESGIRMDTANSLGLTLENVAAPTVIKNDSQYIMVYRGTINQKYPGQVPNSNTQLFLWATSPDGLNFTKKGMALDSRNGEFKGLLDGPEFVLWDDGSIRLYFWSYHGAYHVEFKNNSFSQTAQFDYTTASSPSVEFPQNPPCDPTLTKINNKWFMYYGQHTKGIYYAKYYE